MSNLKIKKAVKLPGLLIIINFLVFLLPFTSYSQIDTSKLRKDLNALLKKYGLKDASFLLKVESLNQKGGQTAFEINNYNGRENHIVNGPNYGINGNVSNEKQLTNQDKIALLNFINKLKKDSSTNTMSYMISTHSTTNGAKVALQISQYLESIGFKYEGGGTVLGKAIEGVQINLRRRNKEDKNFIIDILVGVL